GWREPTVRRGAQLKAKRVHALGEGREPELAAEAPAGDTGRQPAHEHGTARVPDADNDVRSGHHAREVVAVLGRVVEVCARLRHASGTEAATPVDLHRVTDQDLRA